MLLQIVARVVTSRVSRTPHCPAGTSKWASKSSQHFRRPRTYARAK
ncbi:Protein of unknown function [Pyronema omphalodes CBS 100304]|uniref:Uncharacterized protein n=1 Tax=Pyronema omphalodes (strain CBS 100304) TaxID=1076935 RepID=U4LCW0_PYROM|nr:Protein of unknown function [Pyronema omphalodes CBS 100304]